MRSILAAAIEEEADVTLVDMEAGLEHLSRSGGTLAYADVLLVVMEPSRKSILTAGLDQVPLNPAAPTPPPPAHTNLRGPDYYTDPDDDPHDDPDVGDGGDVGDVDLDERGT